MGRQEPVRVEHLAEHPFETGRCKYGEDHQAFAGRPAQEAAVAQALLADTQVAHEAGEMLAQHQRPLDEVLRHDGRGQDRYDPDHRMDPDRDASAVRDQQRVVVEAVLLVPQPMLVHGHGDAYGMFEEGRGQVLVGRVVLGQGQRDTQHRDGVERHPGGRVRLLEAPARRQVGAIERTDVVEAQEPAAEQRVTLDVLVVEPPREVHQQLVEDALEEGVVTPPIDLVYTQRGPRVDRRVHVIEVPLVRRQCPRWMLEPLAAQQQ